MKKDVYPFLEAVFRLEKRHKVFVKMIHVTNLDETYYTALKRKKPKEEGSGFGKYIEKRYKKGLSFKDLNR